MKKLPAVRLLAAAKKARENAYAPYSKYKVGAAVLSASGKIYAACNVENASYGLTICAERAAVAKAVSEGETKLLAAAVVTQGAKPASPCGACRQVLSEFGPNMTVVMATTEGKTLTENLGHLLPHGFVLLKK